MQVRNHSEGAVQLMVRMNAGAVDKIMQNGVEVQVDQKPRLEVIHIPAKAEVAIEDGLWDAAMKSISIVQEMEEQEEEIAGIKVNNKPVATLVKTPTGKTRKVNLLRELINDGTLEVTVKPESKIPVKDMIAALKKQGLELSPDTLPENIKALYEKLC